MQRFYPTLTFKSLTLLPLNLYLLPLHSTHPLMFQDAFPYLLLSFPPDSLSAVQSNAGGLQARSTKQLPCPILLTSSVSRNSKLTHLSLFRCLDSLLCDLIALTPDLAFFLPMTCTIAAASSFSSGTVYSSLKFLSPLSPSLLLDPYSNYVGVNISLNNSSSGRNKRKCSKKRYDRTLKSFISKKNNVDYVSADTNVGQNFFFQYVDH